MGLANAIVELFGKALNSTNTTTTALKRSTRSRSVSKFSKTDFDGHQTVFEA